MKTFGLFGKHPRPGHVKTRLADHVGPEIASNLYAAFLDDLVFRFRFKGEQRLLGFWPADTIAFFDQYTKFGYELWPQPDGDLGAKLVAFFERSLEQNDDRALLIGSDSPTLPSEYVDQAFDLLNDTDCVLGPAMDGGYYLIGLRRPAAELFQDIAWGGANVLTQTIQRATTAELTLNLLPPWYDIDNLNDLQMLAGHIRAMTCTGQTHPCPVTASALDSLRLLD